MQRHPRSQIALVFALIASLLTGRSGALEPPTPVPTTRHHAIYPELTGLQTGAGLGASVAVNQNWVVAAAPSDDLNSREGGIVRVMHAQTNTPFLTLKCPTFQMPRFGSSIALSGSLLAVGAPGDPDSPTMEERVYIYDLKGKSPAVPIAVLKNPSPVTNAGFGSSVAISGQLLVVGASGDRTTTRSGRAYVFSLTAGNSGTPLFTFDGPHPSEKFWFGQSVAIYDGRVAVSARKEYGTFGSGRVYIYEVRTGTNEPVRVLSDPVPDTNSEFGAPLAMEGNRLAVGAPSENSTSGEIVAYGAVYWYDLAGTNPTQAVGRIENPHPTPYSAFGSSLSLSGNRLAIGALGGLVNGVYEGNAYVFDVGTQNAATLLTRLAPVDPTVNAGFGSAVAISGNSAIVGAPHDKSYAPGAGAYYLYDLNVITDHVANATNSAQIPSPAGIYHFGQAVAMEGNQILVGAPRAPGIGNEAEWKRTGAAFIYDLSSPTPWFPSRVLDGASSAFDDDFGETAKLANSFAAVGAPWAHVSEQNHGAVYIYDLTQPGQSLSPCSVIAHPVGGTSRGFGLTVGMTATAEGARLAVASMAYLDGFDQRVVYVYELSRGESGVTVELRATLRSPIWYATHNFATAIAMSGTRLAIAAAGADAGLPGTYGAGEVYIYDLATAQPTNPVFTLRSPDPASGEKFGSSVAMHNDTVVVGSPSEQMPNGASGTVCVFDLSSATPQTAILRIASSLPAEGFQQLGTSVAISGNTILAATNEIGLGPVIAVYDLAGANPGTPVGLLRSPDRHPNNGQFGLSSDSVALNGPTAVIGDPWGTGPASHGSFYVFGTAARAPEAVTIRVGPSERSPYELEWIAEVSPHWSTTHILLEYKLVGSPDVPYSTYSNDILDGYAKTEIRFRSEAILEPASEYDFWLVAENVHGSARLGPFRYATPPDTTPPTINLPVGGFSPRLLRADETGHAFLGAYFDQVQISGEHQICTLSQNPAPWTRLGLGRHHVTLTATDPSGNSATASFSVLVQPRIDDPQKTMIFSVGSPVPGSGVPGSGIPADAVWSYLGSPAINADGDIAFAARWKSPTSKGAGIFVCPPYTNDALLCVQTGDAFPELPNAPLASFRDPTIADDGSLVFLATVRGRGITDLNRSVLCWVSPDRTERRIVAQTGKQIPDVEGAVLDSIASAAILPGGHVAFRGYLNSSPATAESRNMAAFTWQKDSPGLDLALRSGSTIRALGTIRSFQTLNSSPNSPGAHRGWFHFRAPNEPVLMAVANFGNGRKAILATQPNAEPTPWIWKRPQISSNPPTNEFKSFGLPSFSEAQQPAALFRGVSASSGSGLFQVSGPNYLTSLLYPSTQALPIALDSSRVHVGDPLISPDAQMRIWDAWITPSRTEPKRRALVWSRSDGPLLVLPPEGTVAPEYDDFEILLGKFTSFAAPEGSFGPIFQANLKGTSVHSGNDRGLWAVDSTGSIRRLLREGETLSGGPLRKFEALNDTAGAQGTGRCYNRTGQFAIHVVLQDGTSSILRIDVP